jgi:hypothetical protein
MAIIVGGLHGRPSGNVSGVVYGAARTRTGKAVTARELVYPSNPQTPGQMLQRHIFLESLDATRNLAAGLWQDDFNRAIGQLPGFHSMMSIILNNTDALEVLGAPADTPLGNLHFPDTFAVATGAGAAGSFTCTWTNELGGNGTAADIVKAFAIAVDAGVAYDRFAIDCVDTEVRVNLTEVMQTGVAATDMIVGAYVQGAGAAVGLLSPCHWFTVTTHA